jgi:hypothetical protein
MKGTPAFLFFLFWALSCGLHPLLHYPSAHWEHVERQKNAANLQRAAQTQP